MQAIYFSVDYETLSEDANCKSKVTNVFW